MGVATHIMAGPCQTTVQCQHFPIRLFSVWVSGKQLVCIACPLLPLSLVSYCQVWYLGSRLVPYCSLSLILYLGSRRRREEEEDGGAKVPTVPLNPGMEGMLVGIRLAGPRPTTNWSVTCLFSPHAKTCLIELWTLAC